MSVARQLIYGVVAGLFLLMPGIPAARAMPGCAGSCTELVADGGFEAGGAWVLGATELTPQYVTYASHTGSRSLALGIPGGANVHSYSSARQTVSLPAAAGALSLSFWFYAMAAGAPGADHMELVLLDPATDAILDKPWRSANDSRTWNLMTFDLTAWRGRTLQIYFNVYNDGVGGAAAMFLDDVSLTACPPALTPAVTPGWTVLPTATPTATSTPVAGCIDRLLNGGFESGLAYWEAQGDPAGLALVTAPVHSAFYALRLGSLDQNLNGLSSVRQQVAVPAGYSQVLLEFWIQTFAEAGAGADYQEAALLNAYGAVLATPWRVLSDDRTWVRQAFDITAFAGQTLFVRFSVNNDGVGGRAALLLDDVRLLTCTDGTLPAPTATPLPTLVPTWAPSPTSAPEGCVPLVQNGGFEAGAAGWQLGQGPLPAAIASQPVHSGWSSLQLGAQAGDAAAYSSARQWLAIPATHPRVLLQFWVYTWTEAFAGADRQQMVLLGPGDAVLQAPWSVLEDARAWELKQFDITGLAGQTVGLYFNAINDGDNLRTALWVDDVQLWACTPGDWPLAPYADVTGQPPDEGTPETVVLTAEPGAAPAAPEGEALAAPAASEEEALSALAALPQPTRAADTTRVALHPPSEVYEIAVAPAAADDSAGGGLFGGVFARWPAGWPAALVAVIAAVALILFLRRR